MRKLLFALIAIIPLVIIAAGGIKEFSQDTLRFGSSTLGNRSLIFDYAPDGSSASLSVNPSNDEFTFNNIVNMSSGLEIVGPFQIGTGTIDTSSIFDIFSTTKGTRPCPTMTAAQRDAIGTPATGLCVYVSDLSSYYQYDGATWAELGGGGGGGLDVFFLDDFEKTVAADFSKDSDATFLGTTGTFDGVLSDETTSPIAGLSSIKWVGNATAGSNDNDWIALPAITLDDKQKGQDVGVNFYYTWDGTKDYMALKVFCTAPTSYALTSVLDTLETVTNPTRYSTSVYIPLTCTELTAGFQTITGEVSKTFVFDDIEITTNPFVYKNLTDSELMKFSALASTMTSAVSGTLKFGTVTSSGDADLISYDDSTGFFTAVKDIDVSSANISWRAVGTVNIYLETSDGATIYANSTNVASRHETISAPMKLSAGDAIRFRVDGTLDSTRLVSMNILATATTEHVITPQKNSDSQIRLLTGNGHGSTNTYIRRFVTTQDNFGTGVTYADSATLGASFTINESGFFFITYVDQASGGQEPFGISRNSTELTSDISGITAADRLSFAMVASTAGVDWNETSWAGYLEKDDVIRAHTGLTNIVGASTRASFTISRIGFAAMSAVPVPQTMYIDVHATLYNISVVSASTALTTVPLDHLSGDIFGSLAANRVSLPKGTYELVMPVAAYNGVGWIDAFLYSHTDTTTLETFDDVAYSTGTGDRYVQNTPIVTTFTITGTKEIEFRVQAGTTTGGIHASRIKLTKVR